MTDQRPPQLAPVLVLSGGLSLTTLYIAFAYNKLPEHLDIQHLIPIMNIAYTAYYLNRLVQLRNRFAPTQYESQKWPALPVFPGHLERSSLLILAKWLCWATWLGMSSLSSGKPSYKLRWPKDDVDIVYRSVILVQGVFTVLVLVQIRKMRQPEDRVLCEKRGHMWKCGRCEVLQENENTKPTLSSPSYIARPDRTMKLSMLLCSMFVGLSQYDGDRTKMSEPDFVWLAIILPLLTFAHHAIFQLFHAKASVKGPEFQDPWPRSPRFTGKWKPTVYLFGIAAAWTCWFASAFVIADSSSKLWSYHWIIRSAIATVCIMEIILLFLGLVEGAYMIISERHAVCFHAGHAWRCSRICKAKLDTYEGATSKNEISASAPATP